MADFCYECSERIFGEDFGDLAGLCSRGEAARVLCEGCGELIYVDYRGHRVDLNGQPDTPRQDGQPNG